MRRILISLTILALLFIPQIAAGDDLSDLKAAHQKFNQALSSLDAEGIVSIVYPGAVNFAPDAAFPAVLPTENMQAQLTPMLKEIFSNMDHFRINPYNLQYRVIGNIGMVWGHQSQNVKQKGEPAVAYNLRVTTTWIKSDGQWYVLMNHVSSIPSGS